MKLVLVMPWRKNYILYVNELKGDEDYLIGHPDNIYWAPDSERWNADRTIRDAWDEVKATTGAYGSIFNKCQWVGTTGWEFWNAGQDAILATAMKVSERLGIELELE